MEAFHVHQNPVLFLLHALVFRDAQQGDAQPVPLCTPSNRVNTQINECLFLLIPAYQDLQQLYRFQQTYYKNMQEHHKNMAPICKLNRFKMFQEYARINSGIFLHIPAYAKYGQETRRPHGICSHMEMCRNMVEVLSRLHRVLQGGSWGRILHGYHVRRCKQHRQLALQAARHSEP